MKAAVTDLVAAYESGLSLNAVGRLHGIDGSTARYHIKRAGVPIRPWEPPRTDPSEDVEDLLELGEDPSRIPRRLGYKNQRSLAGVLRRRGRLDLASKIGWSKT